MGGNDIAAITKDGAEFDPETPEGAEEINEGYPTIWALARRTIAYLEEAVAFLQSPTGTFSFALARFSRQIQVGRATETTHS